jgi:pilus assembly protein TadC
VTAGAASIGLALVAGLLVAEPRAGVDRLARLTTRAMSGATDPARGVVGPPAWRARLAAVAAGFGLLSGHPAAAAAIGVLAVALGAPAVRATRAEQLRRAVLLADLPRAAELLATCLQAGASPAPAMSAVADAVGGPLAGRLRAVVAFLRSGTDLAHWPADPVDPVDRLVRAVARASRTGAPMAESVQLLAADEAERARWDALERARRAGVQAVGPLAACFLPAFVLLGVVPMIVGVARTVLTGWT